MNIKHKDIHPVELLRIKLDLTQADFARELRLDGLGQYHRLLRSCNERLLQTIRERYSQDLSSDIIAHLVSELRRAHKELKRSRVSQTLTNHDRGTKPIEAEQGSYMDSLIDNLK